MEEMQCIFCKISRKEIPAEIVYEDQHILAIKDIQPIAPVHILIIPKKHISSLNDVKKEDVTLLGHIQLVAKQIAREQEVADKGFRLVNNCGEWGGQAVFHLHYHLLAGKPLGWVLE